MPGDARASRDAIRGRQMRRDASIAPRPSRSPRVPGRARLALLVVLTIALGVGSVVLALLVARSRDLVPVLDPPDASKTELTADAPTDTTEMGLDEAFRGVERAFESLAADSAERAAFDRAERWPKRLPLLEQLARADAAGHAFQVRARLLPVFLDALENATQAGRRAAAVLALPCLDGIGAVEARALVRRVADPDPEVAALATRALSSKEPAEDAFAAALETAWSLPELTSRRAALGAILRKTTESPIVASARARGDRDSLLTVLPLAPTTRTGESALQELVLECANSRDVELRRLAIRSAPESLNGWSRELADLFPGLDDPDPVIFRLTCEALASLLKRRVHDVDARADWLDRLLLEIEAGTLVDPLLVLPLLDPLDAGLAAAERLASHCVSEPPVSADAYLVAIRAALERGVVTTEDRERVARLFDLGHDDSDERAAHARDLQRVLVRALPWLDVDEFAGVGRAELASPGDSDSSVESLAASLHPAAGATERVQRGDAATVLALLGQLESILVDRRAEDDNARIAEFLDEQAFGCLERLRAALTPALLARNEVQRALQRFAENREKTLQVPDEAGEEVEWVVFGLPHDPFLRSLALVQGIHLRLDASESELDAIRAWIDRSLRSGDGELDLDHLVRRLVDRGGTTDTHDTLRLELVARTLLKEYREAPSVVRALGEACARRDRLIETLLEIERTAGRRLDAIAALSALGADEAPTIERAISRLRDSDLRVRLAAVRLLGERSEDAHRAVPALAGVLGGHRRDGDARVRRAAALALGRFAKAAGSAANRLIDALLDLDPGVREEAIRALRRVGGLTGASRTRLAAVRAGETDATRRAEIDRVLEMAARATRTTTEPGEPGER